MNLFAKFAVNPDTSQLIYAVLVIVLVPAALVFNTLYLLRNIQKDMDFELNNKAQLVEAAIELNIRDRISEASNLQAILDELTEKLPEIRAIEVFTFEEDSAVSFASTSPKTKAVSDPILNQLAWGGNQVFSKQIYASLGQGPKERMWLVASPLRSAEDKKIGIINLYLSADVIDKISKKTVTQSLIVLAITMMILLLLLLNHFRFYESAILLKRFRELDKLKDEFISIASHELRTPLTVINSYAYLILKDPIVNASRELKEEVDAIGANAKRLGTLVNDILDVSRIEQNRIQFTMKDLDLRSIIKEVVDELSQQAAEKGLGLKYQSVETPLIVLCDKERMHQIFVNLIGNAIRYTPKGEVTIYHEIEGKAVRSFVKDTGVGISQEDIGKLFQKFSRIYNEKTKETTGTGLGLWITKQLTERMGGKISVESIENQGSQFIVTFPLRISHQS